MKLTRLFYILPGMILLWMGNFHPTAAQQNVVIKQADRIIGITRNGQKIRKLIGDVHLVSDNVEMFSDSTFHFLGDQLLKSYGSIQINTPREHIWADSLRYNMQKEISKFRGRVVVKSDQTLLFSQRINYNFVTRIAFFLSPVRLEDPQGVLTARQGYYMQNRDSAVFRHRVQMRDSLQYVEGDSLYMDRKNDRYEIYGRVYASDPPNNLRLGGHHIEADSLQRRVTGNAYLQRYNRKKQSVDTTHIRAREIIHRQTDSTDIVYAYGNVRIWSRQFSAVADSARYFKQADRFELWSNPRAWSDNIQLTGPYIEILLTGQQVDRLLSYPSPFAVQRDTVLDRFNQIKGDTLTAYFTGGEVSEIHVRPNSQLLYHTKNKKNEPDGAIRVNALSTRIMFENDTLRKVKSKKGIEGTYIPEAKNPAKKRLEGFAWDPKLRPTRPDTTLKRKWPEIPESPPFPLPERYLEFKTQQ